MTDLNMINATSIVGKTEFLNVTDTASNFVINNTSGAVYKINSLIVANTDGTSSVGISVYVNRYSTGLDTYLAKLVAVPAKATLIVISRDTSIYLENGDTLKIVSGTATGLDASCSYEIMS